MWKAQVRNLEGDTIREFNCKPSQGQTCTGWQHKCGGVSGTRGWRRALPKIHLLLVWKKNKVVTEVKKKKKNIISFGWKKDHCIEHVCHFSAKLPLFFDEMKKASLGGASAQCAHVNFLNNLNTCVCADLKFVKKFTRPDFCATILHTKNALIGTNFANNKAASISI